MSRAVAFAVALALASPALAAAEPTDPIGRYNLACKYALAGQIDRSFEWLDKAIAVGFGSVEAMEKDPDLAKLRGDARWPGAVARVRAVANPCKTRPEARQLDFWVGEWEVRDPRSRVVGHSSIQLILNDCVVLENWAGAFGGTGKSFNFWDQPHRRWQQTWVDDRGHVTEYTGQLVGGSMRYAAEGKRLTFSPLPGGRVRQLGESSGDGGKTWSVDYDLTYSRRP